MPYNLSPVREDTTMPKTQTAAKKQRFEATLYPDSAGSSVLKFDIPFSAEEVFGTRARVPVRGTINRFPYRSSIFPMGGKCHMMVVNREMREGAKVKAGDIAKVVMERDDAPRTVTVPADLKKALESNAAAEAAFERLSYTHRKEFVKWIAEAKQPETRHGRLDRTLDMLIAGKHR